MQRLDFAKAAAVMPKVTLPKLHAQYAKACEVAGRYDAAVEAFESAHDMDSVVRLFEAASVRGGGGARGSAPGVRRS